MADGVQAGAAAGLGDAGLQQSLTWGSALWGVTRPCGMVGRGSKALGVMAGWGLTAAVSCAGDAHPAGELLVTRVPVLPPTGPAGNLGRARFPMWVCAGVLAAGPATAGRRPLAAEWLTTGTQASGLSFDPACLCPFTSCGSRGALGGWESVGTAPGPLGARPGDVELAEAAVGWWLEQTKTPGSSVAR